MGRDGSSERIRIAIPNVHSFSGQKKSRLDPKVAQEMEMDRLGIHPDKSQEAKTIEES